MNLEDIVGKTISDFCGRGYTASDTNHCAHFVSHVMDLEFPTTCWGKGNKANGANIRVHEIFAQCPKVGEWENADLDRRQLIFVTNKSNVNIEKKQIKNVREKHVGIYENGFIYHYANKKDKVVKQTVDEFFNYFQENYSGELGLFFGHIPGTDLVLNVNPDGLTEDVADIISFIKIVDGRHYYAESRDGERILVGRKTKYPGHEGLLHPEDEVWGPIYSSDNYFEKYGHWAVLMEVTGYCESKNRFTKINTYNRAAFTFGFSQLAAQTPEDNFVLLLRELLKHENSDLYLPELKLIDGRVHRVDEQDGHTDLEAPTSDNRGRKQLGKLMVFLNPNSNQIDDQEWLYAARLEHWASHDQSMCDKQVEVTFEILTRKFNAYHDWYGLHGVSDVICALIADIHHQGRASIKSVRKALTSNNPADSLIDINPRYQSRANNLRRVIKDLKDQGKLGTKNYDAVEHSFL